MKYLVLFIYFILFSSCVKSIKSEEELFEYINQPKSELKIKKCINEINVAVTYLPSELFVLKEINKRLQNAEPINLDSIKNKYSATMYFQVSFSENDKEVLNTEGGLSNFRRLLNTMAFDLNNYVFITTETNDTIIANDYNLQRTFNLGNSTNLIFSFPKQNVNYSSTLLFNIKEFGLNTGNITLNFDMSKINNFEKENLKIIESKNLIEQ